jgi:MFS family permease
MTALPRHQFRELFLINFLISLGFGISDAFFPLYCQSMGGRGLLLGSAMGGYALSKVLFSPFMGALADRIGRRPVVMSSLMLYLLVSSLYLTTSSLPLVVFLRLLQGAGCAMFRPVVQALVADHAPADSRGRIMGTFDVSFYAALTMGPVCGGIVMDSWGFHGLFSVLVLCCLAALGLAVVSVPWQLTHKKMPGDAEPQTGIWSLSLRGGTLRGLLVFIFGRACGITACATFLPILLSSKLGLSGLQVGIVMASATLAMTLLLRPVGKAADRMPRRLLVICGGTAVPLLYMLLPIAADFTQVLGVTLGIGTFSALSQPAVSALLAEEGQRLGMGATMGSFNSFLNLGFVVGPLVGSLLQTTIGIHGVFVAIGFIGLASSLGFVLAAVARHGGQPPPAEPSR